MTDPAGLPALQEAIRHLHGVDAVHVGTTLVHEQHQGQTVWRGDVETFDIIGHPRAYSGVCVVGSDNGDEAPLLCCPGGSADRLSGEVGSVLDPGGFSARGSQHLAKRL